MYVQRKLKPVFDSAIKQFPAVLITGPRQSGKTTFLQHEKPDFAYITFDDPLNRDFALQDPNGFLDQFSENPVILDEIQYVPEILQYLKIRIDRDRTPGKWILTGSQQFHLMKNIGETLVGRIAILELLPFSLNENPLAGSSITDIVWTGLYPEPACYPEKRDLWVKSYIQTYLERDIRQLETIRDFRSFEMFVGLSAAFHSYEFHPAELARNCGVSQPTIKSWSKLLEASYFALLLPPFFNNFGKRLIKSSKFYFTDPSFVCYLTRQPSSESALSGNLGGALFEGLIISETYKTFFNRGLKPSLYFWRSQGGMEVDLIIHAQGKFWPVEIKLTATPTPAYTKNMHQFKSLAKGSASDQGLLVCRVDKPVMLPGNNLALPWHDYSAWLEKIL